MYNDDIVSDNSLGAYMRLYNAGTSIHKKKPLNNEHYKIFSLANTDIRVLDRDKVNELTVPLSKLHYFINDHTIKNYNTDQYISMKGNRFFYMIPIQDIEGHIISFGFRRVLDKDKTNRYYSLKGDHEEYIKSPPIFYGWYKDFENFDEDSKKGAKPIVLCEGIKDCIYLKQYYPYVLALNGSSMSMKGTSLLRYLTDKIVFVPDNDEPGMRAFLEADINLTKSGFSTSRVKLDGDIKDAASYINHPDLENIFKMRFLRIIRELENATIQK